MKPCGSSVLALALLAAVVLPACAVQQDIARDGPLVLPRDEGVIVGSVTAPPVQHYAETMLFEFRSTDGSVDGYLTSGASDYTDTMFGLLERPDPGLEAELGRTFAVRLPAGSYEISRLFPHRTPGFDVAAHARFEVQPGVVTYVGNLHVDQCVGMVTRLRANIIGSRPQVRDEEARDVALLRARFPALRELPIRKALLAAPTWLRLPCAADCFRPEHGHDRAR